MENLFFESINGNISYGGHLKYEDPEYIIVAEGDIYLSDEKIPLLKVAELLRDNGDLMNVDGLFSMIVFNKNTGKLIALQDIFAYIHPLYYQVFDDGICVALLMKQIIIDTKIPACLQKENVTEFLYNGFLTDDRCLIEGIKKIPAMHMLTCDIYNKIVRYVKREYRLKTEMKAQSDYSVILEKNLSNILDGRSEINMALSSGFDSNFILNTINRLKPNIKINAFSIGASNGNDEIDNVVKICTYHPEVVHNIEKVTNISLQSLPQMVFELEDSIFERGIFLQYVMSELLLKNKVDHIILGEGADQILSSEFKTTADKYYFVGTEKHYPWVYYPYEMLTYIILKKNGIFLRNRDIQSFYPFIKENFIQGVYRFRQLNGTSKNHYKSYILSRVKKEIGELLTKRPGSTNLSTLFNNNNQDLLKIAKMSEFYQYLPKQPDRDSGAEVELDNCLKILYIMVFEELFCNQNVEMLKHKEVDISLDKLIDRIMQKKTGAIK